MPIMNSQELKQAIKVQMVNNVITENPSSRVTILIEGTHGIGKTQIANGAVADLIYAINTKNKFEAKPYETDGKSITVDGGFLGDGDLSGMPFLTKNEKGDTVFKFIPHFSLQEIQDYQKEIWNKATTVGLLNGKLKLDPSTNIITYDDGTNVYQYQNCSETIRKSFTNKYSFGENLPSNIKKELLNNKDILPVQVFFDEINRSSREAYRPIMNLTLNRQMQDYKLPFWVVFIGAMNPSGADSNYATMEMDDAERDRFTIIEFKPTLEEWCDYMLNKYSSPKYKKNSEKVFAFVTAISQHPEIFTSKGTSPRSLETAATTYADKDDVYNTGFFTAEETSNSENIAFAMIEGKVGRSAMNLIRSTLKNPENYVDVKKLIDLKENKLNQDLAKRVARMPIFGKRVVVVNTLRYISTDLIKYALGKTKTDQENWKNIQNQLSELMDIFDPATRLVFAKMATTTLIDLDDLKYSKYKNMNIYIHLFAIFGADIVNQLSEHDKVAGSAEINDK